MERISKALERINPQPSSDSVSLTTRSGPPLPAGMGLILSTLMAEVQARYPNQTLPPGTPDMYLVEWERMVLRFGLATFREGLSKVIRESRFFPDPLDIEDHCRSVAEAERNRTEQEKWNRHLAEWKAEYERERAEDARLGRVREKTELEKKLDGILEAARTAKQRVAKQEPEPSSVKHEVTTQTIENGWFRQCCACGVKPWNTLGRVPTCPSSDWKQHKRELEQGLRAAQEAK